MDTSHLTPVDRQDGWQRKTLPDLFEQQVEETPAAPAMVFEGETLTYRQLGSRANQLAHALQSIGVGPESVVALLWERASNVLSQMVAFWGIQKAGGALLYLEASYPRALLLARLKDAHCSVVLTERGFLSSLDSGTDASPSYRTVCLDEQAGWLAGFSAENPTRAAHAMDTLAYIIYTSGSTSAPKGVQVTHQGIGNLAQAFGAGFGIRPGDRMAQFFSWSFDGSIAEIIALLSGATLYPISRQGLNGGQPLARFLEEQGIAHAIMTPSVLATLPPAALPTLRTLVVAAQVCPAHLVKTWATGRSMFNAYGPTEATVCVSFGQCHDNGLPPTIGKPLPNVEVSIRDVGHLPVQEGAIGEICIGGICLARGYTDPAATAERFIADPDPLRSGSRLYLTGDRGRIDEEGDIVFLGRLEEGEVKTRTGHRVVLADIEDALRALVPDCAVIASEEGQLVACVVLPPQQAPSIKALQRHLKGQVPDYMLPRAFVIMEALPRTASDKIDRRALVEQLPHWRAAAQNGVSRAASSPGEVRLAEIVAEVLNQHLFTALTGENINLFSSFHELGGDSLSTMDLLLALAAAFQRELDESDIERLTLEQLCQLLLNEDNVDTDVAIAASAQ